MIHRKGSTIELPSGWKEKLDALQLETKDNRSGFPWTDVETDIIRCYYIPLRREHNLKALVTVFRRSRTAIYTKGTELGDWGLLLDGTIEENKKVMGF